MSDNKWKSLVLVLASLAVVLLAGRLAIRWHGERALRIAGERFAAEVWPLDLWSHARREIEARDNVAHWAEAGSAALTFTDEESRALRRAVHLPAADWSAGDRRLVGAALEENAAAVELLHRTASLSESSFDLDLAAGIEMPMPDLAAILKGARLLLAELRLAALEDRPRDAILAARSLRSLARACEGESPLIFQLIGLTVERLYWEGARTLVDHGHGGEALPAELRRPPVDTGVGEQFRRALRFEASLALAAEHDYLLRPHHEAAALRYLRHVAEGYARSSEAQWREQPAAPRKPAMMPEMRHAAQKFKAAEALRELAVVALDLYLESRRRGSFPADLSEYPEAGTNAYTGEALEYRIAADGSAMIEIAGAVELWKARNAPHDEYPPPFSWRLPPPDRERSASRSVSSPAVSSTGRPDAPAGWGRALSG